MERKTPIIYKDAISRAVLPIEKSGIGLSFDVADGSTVRLFIDHDSARFICGVLEAELRRLDNPDAESRRLAETFKSGLGK